MIQESCHKSYHLSKVSKEGREWTWWTPGEKNLPGRGKNKCKGSTVGGWRLEAGEWVHRPAMQKGSEQEGRAAVAEVGAVWEARLCTYNWLSLSGLWHLLGVEWGATGGFEKRHDVTAGYVCICIESRLMWRQEQRREITGTVVLMQACVPILHPPPSRKTGA